MDIQAETLITLVQERPVLWDKTEDVYKDKNLKLAAWREVCLILKPNFDELDEKERKQYVFKCVPPYGRRRLGVKAKPSSPTSINGNSSCKFS
ncbi:Uncharacterized protein OBRU01_07634 [Operophtera brumata]|uniref:MADF domain-containing protein n=1 Tax=Operophtera brumata TaxID=104452 RepID=A0A0L7LIW9_OPEBR|nr:Uncharacterized protein OBRU01_07634 [Operophtera brumata]